MLEKSVFRTTHIEGVVYLVDKRTFQLYFHKSERMHAYWYTYINVMTFECCFTCVHFVHVIRNTSNTNFQTNFFQLDQHGENNKNNEVHGLFFGN